MSVERTNFDRYEIRYAYRTEVISDVQLKERLQNLSNFEADKHWLRYDLTLSPSSCLGRFFWCFLQHFQCLRSLFYRVNHINAQKMLYSIKKTIVSSDDNELKELFGKAVHKYNMVVSHCFVSLDEGVMKPQPPPMEKNVSGLPEAPKHVHGPGFFEWKVGDKRPIQFFKYSEDYLIEFYTGQTPNFHGKLLTELQTLSNDPKARGPNKEDEHWFIQWMFPLTEPSEAQPGAWGPVIEKDTFESLRQNPLILQNMRNSFDEILTFWGLKYNKDKKTVEKRVGEREFNFDVQAKNWMDHTHNYPRMNRVLKSMLLFGLVDEAKAFYKCLCDLKDSCKIPETSFQKYWDITMKDHLS